MKETGATIAYQVGTMIELPRACLRAARDRRDGRVLLLRHQRPDADRARHLARRRRDLPRPYTQKGILPADPFVTIDQEGVGELVRIGVERGRRVRNGPEARHLRRARRRPRLRALLRRDRPRLRVLLALPRADRPPRRRAGGARQQGGEPGLRRASLPLAGRARRAAASRVGARRVPLLAPSRPALIPDRSPAARPHPAPPSPQGGGHCVRSLRHDGTLRSLPCLTLSQRSAANDEAGSGALRIGACAECVIAARGCDGCAQPWRRGRSAPACSSRSRRSPATTRSAASALPPSSRPALACRTRWCRFRPPSPPPA